MSRATIPAIIFAAGLALASGQQVSAQDADTKRRDYVLGCEEAARRSIDRDRLIGRSITGAQEPDPFGGGGSYGSVGGSFTNELSRYEEERRRQRLIDDCLARGGFEPESE